MKAMLLAAGEGRRLRPLTSSKPKPMIEVAGVPILEHNIRLLVRHGITQIMINLWHAPRSITEHVDDGSKFGASVAYSREESLLGTAGALARVAGWFDDEDFMVVYGDNLSTCDLAALSAQHRETSALVTMAIFEREAPQAGGVVEIDHRRRVTRFTEKPTALTARKAWVNAGYLAMHPSTLRMIPTHIPSDLSRDLLEPMVARGDAVYAFPIRDGLWWVDSPEDYERTCRHFARESSAGLTA